MPEQHWIPQSVTEWVVVVLLGLVVWAIKSGIPAAIAKIDQDRRETLEMFGANLKEQREFHREEIDKLRADHRDSVKVLDADVKDVHEAVHRVEVLVATDLGVAPGPGPNRTDHAQ